MAHGMQAMPRDVDRFLGHVQEASRPGQGRSLIYRHFWVVSGYGVQAMSGKRHAVQDISGMQPNFQVVSRTRCAGHVWDASGPRQGRSLIFKHFWEVSGHGVQGMVFRPCSGHILVMAVCGRGVQVMSGMHPGCGRDAAKFSGISGQFMGHGEHDMSKMQPDFQSFLGSVGHVREESGSRPSWRF
ncbi:Hypothetical predicted protein [Olea europaea subsp. europaea]|uniref:Uncharacterized protein n=1 Tax=Olea europaea subsp. europaea TaxID=158383 RepID=A0A8S0S1P4_OLEEU|nr:Hypothetical predicted protein [Olea europaea subsp. europaea]